MSRATRIGGAVAGAIAVAVISVGGAAVLDSGSTGRGSSGSGSSGSGSSGGAPSGASIRQRIETAVPGTAPFPKLTETTLLVGGQSLGVVVADDDAERTAGLRQRSDLGRYDGMIFAFEAQTQTGFTMSTVPVALDIGFYDDAGRVVDRLRMEPCAGVESECPVYRSSGPFHFALETLAGDLPVGPLTG